MKKLLPILCVLCLLLTACTPFDADTSSQNSTVSSSSDTTVEQTSSAPEETTADPTSGLYISWKDIYFNTLEEYEAYFAENEDIQIAVTYEKLQKLGDFTYFIFLSRAILGDYSSYYYGLCDSLGYEFNLSIEPRISYEELHGYEMVDPPADGDLRTLDRPRTGFFTVDGITYSYFQGKLKFVQWESSGLGLTLSLQEEFYTYPENDTTFVGKILNINTAAEAVDSLTASISDAQ